MDKARLLLLLLFLLLLVGLLITPSFPPVLGARTLDQQAGSVESCARKGQQCIAQSFHSLVREQHNSGMTRVRAAGPLLFNRSQQPDSGADQGCRARMPFLASRDQILICQPESPDKHIAAPAHLELALTTLSGEQE